MTQSRNLSRFADNVNTDGSLNTLSTTADATVNGLTVGKGAGAVATNTAVGASALAAVAKLKPVTYNWKADGSEGQGFIAHELQAVVPECVTGEKDAVDENGNPKYQGIDTSFLVATLTKAIQEQQAIITQLQADVTSLKAQLTP